MPGAGSRRIHHTVIHIHTLGQTLKGWLGTQGQQSNRLVRDRGTGVLVGSGYHDVRGAIVGCHGRFPGYLAVALFPPRFYLPFFIKEQEINAFCHHFNGSLI